MIINHLLGANIDTTHQMLCKDEEEECKSSEALRTIID